MNKQFLYIPLRFLAYKLQLSFSMRATMGLDSDDFESGHPPKMRNTKYD
jgi:hypothetical protein